MGITFLCETAVFLCCEETFHAVLCAIAVPAACILLSRCRPKECLLLFGCAAFAALSLFLHTAVHESQIRDFLGKETDCTLVVSETRQRGRGTVLEGTARLRRGETVRFLPVEVTVWSGSDARIGDVVSLKAKAASGKQTIAGIGEPLSLTQTAPLDSAAAPKVPALAYRLTAVRSAVLTAAAELTHGDAEGVLCALLAGDRSRLSGRITADFRRAGLSHLLVVSGMHLCIAAALAERLFSRLREKRRFFAVCTVVWLCAALTGFGVSVVRAAVMVTAGQSAVLFERKSDTLTSLSLAGLLIALASPAAVISVSFLLSFCAVFGIALFADPIERLLAARLPGKGKTRRLLYAPLAVSAAAQLGTLPVTAVCFGTVPALGLAANLIAVPLLTPILFSGVCGVLIVPLRGAFGLLCRILIGLLCKTAAFFAEIPFAQLGFGERWQLAWIFCVFVISALCVSREVSLCLRRTLCLLGAAVLCCGSAFSLFAARQSTTVIFFPQDGTALLSRGSRAVLLGAPEDSYAADRILSAMARQNLFSLEAVLTEDIVLPTALFSVTAEVPAGGIAAPDTPANRALCHAAGQPLCQTEELMLFCLYPAEIRQNAVTVVIDQNGAALCPCEEICVIIKESFCTPRPPSDGALCLRRMDRRTT